MERTRELGWAGHLSKKDSSLAVNRTGRDVNRLSSSRAEVQNKWSYTFVCLQCINRENSVLLFCANYIKWKLQLTIFFFLFPPKGASFLCQLQTEKFLGSDRPSAGEKQQNSE